MNGSLGSYGGSASPMVVCAKGTFVAVERRIEVFPGHTLVCVTADIHDFGLTAIVGIVSCGSIAVVTKP
jgi:hypothetical protein